MTEAEARAELAQRWAALSLSAAADDTAQQLADAHRRNVAALVEELARYNVRVAHPRPPRQPSGTAARVLALSQAGRSLRQIADELGLSRWTITAHRKKLSAAGHTWPRLPGGGSQPGPHRGPRLRR